ncbi:MAG: DUF6457 domain-containing protein [Candidatus Dormibacteria bacterium]
MAESWPQRYAAALQARAGVHFAEAAVSPAVMVRLLDLARNVAHGTERRNAPLATYLAGQYVALRMAQGCDPSLAVAEAVGVAEGVSSAPPPATF